MWTEIEKEIEDLETQELNISANEEVILKRLKEVERTAEDIIKVDLISPTPLTLSDPLLTVSPSPRIKPRRQEFEDGKPKKATFAMEISVEHDTRTGESHVVAMSTITPEAVQEKGVKVYDDGRKSVYAINHVNQKRENEGLEEMTPSEVEELLRQALDKEVPSEVQYNQPVYSTSYIGNSSPSTPRTPSKTPRQTPTTCHSPLSCMTSNGAQDFGSMEGCHGWVLAGSKSPCSPGPSKMPQDGAQGCEAQQSLFYIPNQAHASQQPDSLRRSPKPPLNLTNGHADQTVPKAVTLVSVKAQSEGVPVPIQPVYRSDDVPGPFTQGLLSGVCTPDPVIDNTLYNRGSPFYQESEASLNLINTLTEDFETEPVIMIFMGFKNAEDNEDEEDFQAELVMISNSDEDEGDNDCKSDNYDDGSGDLSYHPEGYKSKVFCPRIGVANVSGSVAPNEDIYTNCDEILPCKPTFIHKPGKSGPCMDRQPRLVLTWKR
ncbi:Palmdelphin [Merluccius polli]|uniref:Palmdelphin n=1 Tax=Merluccius polli TaxID=89951 RepID=A0AA47P6X9_MERPO|nr:Palmdelphin [Merluccius polli]